MEIQTVVGQAKFKGKNKRNKIKVISYFGEAASLPDVNWGYCGKLEEKILNNLKEKNFRAQAPLYVGPPMILGYGNL